MKQSGQMSDSLLLGLLLALSGGFMDAYTYVFRGHVYANAQTGNVILLSIQLTQGNIPKAVEYAVPILAFVMGVGLVEIIRHRHKNMAAIHWRQVTIFAEAAILFFVGFLPQSLNLAANSLVSFACGIQVESFRTIRGFTIATTMCIGNLRTGAQSLFHFFLTKEKKALRTSALLLGAIAVFALGAVLGDAGVGLWQEKAIWGSSLLTFLGFCLMFRRESKAGAQPGK